MQISKRPKIRSCSRRKRECQKGSICEDILPVLFGCCPISLYLFSSTTQFSVYFPVEYLAVSHANRLPYVRELKCCWGIEFVSLNRHISVRVDVGKTAVSDFV